MMKTTSETKSKTPLLFWAIFGVVVVAILVRVNREVDEANKEAAQAAYFRELQAIETRHAIVAARAASNAAVFQAEMDARKLAARLVHEDLKEQLKTIEENTAWESRTLRLEEQQNLARARLGLLPHSRTNSPRR